jgi:hypothetical protein
MAHHLVSMVYSMPSSLKTCNSVMHTPSSVTLHHRLDTGPFPHYQAPPLDGMGLSPETKVGNVRTLGTHLTKTFYPVVISQAPIPSRHSVLNSQFLQFCQDFLDVDSGHVHSDALLDERGVS